MRVRETVVIDAVGTWLTAEGWQWIPEYPVMGKVVDILARRTGEDRLVAVECKERDWGRAVRQAVVYQAAADEAYVAVPSKAVTANLTNAAARLGIGVLAVDELQSVQMVVEAGREVGTVKALRDRAWTRFSVRYDTNAD